MKVIYKLLLGEISLDEILHHYNANITYIRLPDKINGFIFPYKNINNIFINIFLSDKGKKEAILHELSHLELNQTGQIDNDLLAYKVDRYETEVNNYVRFLVSNIGGIL